MKTSIIIMKQGAAQFCRVDAFRQIGGYDESSTRVPAADRRSQRAAHIARRGARRVGHCRGRDGPGLLRRYPRKHYLEDFSGGEPRARRARQALARACSRLGWERVRNQSSSYAAHSKRVATQPRRPADRPDLTYGELSAWVTVVHHGWRGQYVLDQCAKRPNAGIA